MGLLERCHSYKDKKARLADDDLDQVNHGLFAYPVLMAADILISTRISFPSDAIRNSTSK